MSLTRVSAPAVEPLTETEVWDHLKLDYESNSPAEPDDKTLVAALLTAVTSMLDGKDGLLQRCIVEQTWDLKLDCFPAERVIDDFLTTGAPIMVPLPPLQSVTSITYIDENGTSQTLSSSLYVVDASSQPGRIVPAYGQTWPNTRSIIDAVTVRFVAGYTKVDSPLDYRANVPGAIKAAMKLMIGHLYANREAVVTGTIVTELPMAVQSLLAPFTRPRV